MEPRFLLTLVVLCVAAARVAAAQPTASTELEASWRMVRVAAHGMHSGLVLDTRVVRVSAWPARGDFPDAEFLEVGWGEREYYMRDDAGISLGLRALFWSNQSVLHVVGFRGSPQRQFPEAEIVALRVSVAGFERLLAFIRDTHTVEADGRPIVLAPGSVPNSLFYASDRRFRLFESCNTWVARALREAGLPMEPLNAFMSSGLMMQVRAVARPEALAAGGVH